MPIIPERLVELRKRKNLTRAGLHQKSKIAPRQIARLESETGAATTPRDRTVNQLAKALGVDPGVLTGEMPMPKAESAEPASHPGIPRQVSAWLLPETSLACALIQRRYGINFTTLVNVAPLMFVLLAEGSFRWRQEKLTEAEKTKEELVAMATGYRGVLGAISDVEEWLECERQSIKKRDLFGKDIEELGKMGVSRAGHDPFQCNPFADYLRALAEGIDSQDVVYIEPEDEDTIHGDGPLKGFPGFNICEEDQIQITCERDDLKLALYLGLRINHIPKSLLSKEEDEKRQKWLEQQIEEQFPPSLKALLSSAITKNVIIDTSLDDDEERIIP